VTRLIPLRRNLWLNVAIVAFVVVPNVYVLLAAVIPIAFFIPAANAAVNRAPSVSEPATA